MSLSLSRPWNVSFVSRLSIWMKWGICAGNIWLWKSWENTATLSSVPIRIRSSTVSSMYSAQISSVREVLPGRPYFIPETQEKEDPLTVSEGAFVSAVCSKAAKLSKALYTSLTGISPVAAEEIVSRASLDSDRAANSYEPEELDPSLPYFPKISGAAYGRGI